MFSRDSYHDCANRLTTECKDFRLAFDRFQSGDRSAERNMLRSSIEGYTTLRSIALSVRPETDYGYIKCDQQVVGRIIKGASEQEVALIIDNPDNPNIEESRFSDLTLRDALNKIAHASPRENQSGFSLANNDHRIILSGEGYGKSWVSITSLTTLTSIIRNLPDREITEKQ